ncbi:hypothetical protein SNE25_21285 [Mucilaginibacter sabulilitoris]|uniref:HTH cro/C1-type domain-containing protein n=1 Tax=Mucilaginibacter sabulilitoris TaxID=1173583 RepID=A0ABZ0TL13_9SPHI|nr:hypothetical protein [Mucilaginibacter sabulilitoris]WPU91855.1 hypothetical protein SNE25_21285 [Mucilaginibacter sabulilitoris]
MPKIQKSTDEIHPVKFDLTLANRLTFFREKHINKVRNTAAEMLELAASNLLYMEKGKAPIKFEFVAKLVKEYNLNQVWFNTGKGREISTKPEKTNLITDLNTINSELGILKKFLKMMEANQNYLMKQVERQAKEMDKLQAELENIKQKS